MPYVVTTKLAANRISDVPEHVVSRLAVATLEEARTACMKTRASAWS